MKRFSETDKWKDTWFRKLKPAEKLLWLYIVDNCDNAGFIELDVELIAFITKMPDEQITGAIEGLNRGLTGAKDASCFLVKDFLKHQKNLPLNPENNAHKQIILLIADKSPLFPVECKKLLGANKGLISPIGKGKGKGVVGYEENFDSWWGVYKKGVKADAFKRWKEQKNKPELPELIKSSELYASYCKANDRTQRDGAGFMSGRLWETEWIVPKQSEAVDFNAEEYGL